MVHSREYVNLTYYLPGSATTVDEDFHWNFQGYHTFCVQAKEEHLWRRLEDWDLKHVADKAVEQAKELDVRFLGHEGGGGE